MPSCELPSPMAQYNAKKDIPFFEYKATTFIDVKMCQFFLFFPDDGHQPGIGEGTYMKIIVKIKVK